MRSPMRVAAAIGAAWGFAAYAVLWGYTPIVVQRPFVLSVIGTVLLLPVRIVLWAIHVLERSAGRPFDLAENNWWIGLIAAVVGAAIVALATWGIRAIGRTRRGSGGEQLAEPAERV